MRRSTLKWLLVLALIVGSTGGVSSVAMADEHENLADYRAATKLYFPFVPNDTTVGDSGSWHSSITIQNMESDEVQFWVLPDGEFDPASALYSTRLLDNESVTITADELGIDADGGSLVVAAMNDEVWQERDDPNGLSSLDALDLLEAPEVSATLKMASGADLEDGVWTDEAHESVDGYSAIPMNDVGWGQLSVDCPSGDLNSCGNVEELENVDGTSYLPLAQTNDGWNTTLYVTNVDGASPDPSLVDVELIPTADSENDETWTQEMTLEPGETWPIDLASEVGLDWIGSVRISSDAGTAAVAARHKPSTDMMLLNTSAPSRIDEADGYRLSAPLVYVDYFGWNTGISIANQSSNANHVEVDFYDEDGDLVETASETIDGDGHGYIYLPGEVDDDDGWLGSAVLESASDRPFHAAVDQVNYDNGAAMSYTLGSVGADAVLGHDRLGLALAQKANSRGDEGDASGIQLFNPDPDNDVVAEIQLYEAGGSPIDLTMDDGPEFELGPRESRTIYLPDEGEIPIGTIASAVITVTGGDGEMLAVSNLVNYEVQGDGAVVLPLTNGHGQLR